MHGFESTYIFSFSSTHIITVILRHSDMEINIFFQCGPPIVESNHLITIYDLYFWYQQCYILQVIICWANESQQVFFLVHMWTGEYNGHSTIYQHSHQLLNLSRGFRNILLIHSMLGIYSDPSHAGFTA